MKQCINSYIDPLTLLINQSIQQGVFLAELKIARCIPLYKGDNNQLIHNTIDPFPYCHYFKEYLRKKIFKSYPTFS